MYKSLSRKKGKNDKYFGLHMNENSYLEIKHNKCVWLGNLETAQRSKLKAWKIIASILAARRKWLKNFQRNESSAPSWLTARGCLRLLVGGLQAGLQSHPAQLWVFSQYFTAPCNYILFCSNLLYSFRAVLCRENHRLFCTDTYEAKDFVQFYHNCSEYPFHASSAVRDHIVL